MNKKLLFLSFTVLFSGLFAFAQKPVNVSDKYMDNYTDPYYYKNKIDSETGDTIGEFDPKDVLMYQPTVNVTLGGGIDAFQMAMPRYHVIDAPWKTEGTIGELGIEIGEKNKGTTGWHVDIQKGKQGRIRGTLTLTSGWNEFAATFDNMKVYQTTKVAVPAGKYDVVANWGQDKSGAPYTFLVVSKGTSIPDTINLATDANVLGYEKLSYSTETGSEAARIKLDLATETSLTIGFVASFPEHPDGGGKGYCVAMGDFEIIKWVKGTNYSELKQTMSDYSGVNVANYPFGTTPGQYSQEAWDEFESARKSAQAIIDNIPTGDPLDPNYKDNATQEDVDTAIKAIKDTYKVLRASMVMPIKFSSATKSFYYRVSDFRDQPNYWTMGSSILSDGTTEVNRLLYVQEVDQADERMMFKFVKKESAEGNEFFIYNKASEEHAISVYPGESNMVVIVENGKDTTWMLSRSLVPNSDGRFLVTLADGKGSNKLNSFGGKTFVGFWNDAKDKGNTWFFERVYLDGEANFGQLNKAVLIAKDMLEEKYPIGTGLAEYSQEAWNKFVAARTLAEAVLAKEYDDVQPKQSEIDDAAKALNEAIETLNNSLSDPLLFSTDTNEHYYMVHDKRTVGGAMKSAPFFWQVAEADVKVEETVTTYTRLLVSTQPNNADDSFKFKFVKKDETSSDFYIYSKLNKKTPLSVSEYVKNLILVDTDAESQLWKLGRTPAMDAKYFTVSRATPITDDNGDEVYQQLNSYTTAGYVGFWNPPADDAGNDWSFVESVDTSVENVTLRELGIFVRNRKVYSNNSEVILNIYSISGQKLNVKNELVPGVYIVNVEGREGNAKVLVR